MFCNNGMAYDFAFSFSFNLSDAIFSSSLASSASLILLAFFVSTILMVLLLILWVLDLLLASLECSSIYEMIFAACIALLGLK